MAVAFDKSNSTSGTGVSSLSWSHNAAGTNRAILAAAGTSAFGGPPTHDSATHNSVGMTNVTNFKDPDQDNRLSLWVLANPATGNKTVAVTFSGSADEAGGGSCTFEGVDQTTPVDTGVTNYGNDTTPTVDVTGGASDDMVVDATYHFDSTTSLTSNQTLREEVSGIGSFSGFAMSTAAGSASTVTMSYSITSDNWNIAAVNINQTSGGGGLSIPVAMHHYQQQKQA